MKKIRSNKLLGEFKLIPSFFLAMLCISMQSSAQGNLSTHIGPSFPMGKFADDEDAEFDGAAGIGLGLGAQYVYPLNDNGLGLFGGLDILIHGIKKEIRDDYIEENPDSKFKFESYINIPLSAGIHYAYPVKDNLSLYGKLGLTASFLKMTKFLWEEEGDDDYIEKYDLSTTVGILFGAGVVLNEQIELGFSIMSLGKHKVNGEFEYGTNNDTFDFERQVSLFNLTFGYMLP